MTAATTNGVSQIAQATLANARTSPRRMWAVTGALSLLLILLPTALTWDIGRRFGLPGPYLNLDFGATYLLSVLLSRRVPSLAIPFTVFAIAGILAVQALIAVGLIYLDTPSMMRDYFSFMPYWPWRVIGIWLSASAVGILGLFLIVRRIPLKDAKIWPVAIIFTLVAGADLAARTEVGYRFFGANVATSSAVRLFRMLDTWRAGERFTYQPSPGVTEARIVESGNRKPERILSVAVESMGAAANDDTFNTAMFFGLNQRLGGLYDIEISRHPFKGATLAGEFRALCSLQISGKPSAAEAAALESKCLPKILSQKGYYTSGLHGNSSYFYNRKQIYPNIGFRETEFYDDLLAKHGKVCRTGAFTGICDSSVFETALETLGGHRKSFVHVMTLDTHFPLRAVQPQDRDCGRGSSTGDSELCLYRNQMSRVLDDLADAICAARAKPDAIYVFGDHAPPFATATERNFFDRDRVPFVTLSRRDPTGRCRPNLLQVASGPG